MADGHAGNGKKCIRIHKAQGRFYPLFERKCLSHSFMINLFRCNLCGSTSYSILYKTYSGDIASEEKDYRITDHTADMPLRIVKCGRCGLIYANPRPAVRSLVSAYARMVDDDYVKEEEGRRLSAQSRMGGPRYRAFRVGHTSCENKAPYRYDIPRHPEERALP